MKRVLLAGAIALSAVAAAQPYNPIYQNVQSGIGTGGTSTLQAYYGSGLISGTPPTTTVDADDITFAAGSAGKSITRLIFSLYNPETTTFTVRPNLFFWNSNGTGGDPGTLLATTTLSPVSLAAQSINYFGVSLTAGTFVVPASNSIWAGISWDNGGGATATAADLDAIGQGVLNTPSVGSSDDLFWESDNAGPYTGANNPVGADYDFGGNPVANFGWEFDTTPVPEPATIAMLGLGVAALVRRRRR